MKKFISILSVLVITCTTVFATSAQTKLNNTKNEIAAQQQKLNEVKKEKKNTLSEIDSLDKQITTTENTIDSLEEEIKDLETQITVAENNIEYAEKQYELKDDIRKKRVATYYEQGIASYWDILLSSSNMSDFLYRKQMLADVIEYDNNLLQELHDEREEIAAQKTELDNNKVICENKKIEAENKKLALNDTKTVRTKYLAELNASEETLNDSIDELNKQADALVAEINAAASKNTKYTGGKMTWPLPGYYTVTSPFGNRLHPVLKVYKMHTGIDIAGSGCNGKNVVAAADGKVITAGWISGYGNTVVIDHGGGITTLYGHSQKLLVKVGQQVKKGDPIMLVGMTGYATGPHLHFEVRENGKYVNPLDGYLKN